MVVVFEMNLKWELFPCYLVSNSLPLPICDDENGFEDTRLDELSAGKFTRQHICHEYSRIETNQTASSK